LIDRRRAACQHHQPVETKRNAACLGHTGNRGEEVLVQRIALAVSALLFVHRKSEPPALLGGIGQFTKSIRQFDTTGIDLETLGDAWIG
jgi:hypothetical protein